MSEQFVAINWHWNGQPEVESFKALELLGLHVYEDPAYAGSSDIGFLISKKPMTREDMKKYLMEDHTLSAEEAEECLNFK